MSPVPQSLTLSEHHRLYLADNAIDPELAERHGVVSHPDGGLIFPYRGPRGRVVEVFRPDDPGDGPKYVSPKGQAPGLNVVIAEGDTVLLVEGTRQALAAASYAPADTAVIGINGCRGWSYQGSPSPDLDVVHDRHVVVAFDADVRTNPDVHKAAEGLRSACETYGARSVRFLDAGGTDKDGLDDLLAGLDISERQLWLQGLLDAATEDLGPSPEAEGDADIDASWDTFADLADAWHGRKSPAEPGILMRTDGRALFYGGQLNYLHGSDSVGKSFVALFAAAEQLRAGEHVVWLDWEDPDEVTVATRLRDLGLTWEQVERFHYLHPETESSPANVARLAAAVKSVGATLVIVDSVGEAFGMDSVNENNDSEVTPWFRRVLRPLLRAGAAVIGIDHGVKDETNKLHPSGSKRKRASVTGSHFLVEAPTSLSRDSRRGLLRLTTAKDRHGYFQRGKVAAEIHVIIDPIDGAWQVEVSPPARAVTADDAAKAGGKDDIAFKALAREAVRAARQQGKPVTMNVLAELLPTAARLTRKWAAIQHAVDEGALTETRGERRARLVAFNPDAGWNMTLGFDADEERS